MIGGGGIRRGKAPDARFFGNGRARGRRHERGATFLDVILAVAIGATVTAMSVPAVADALEDMRTAMAARYVAARVATTRLDALRRSDAVALRFEAEEEDFRFASFADGNGNGVRSTEIRTGVDPSLAPFERLRERFPGVRFGLTAGIPDADGQAATGEDGVRVGSSRLLSISADGTATSGTLYIRSRRRQYAVRILGATGRTRVLEYQPETRSWIAR